MAIWVPDFSVGSSQEVRDANANALQAAFNAAAPNDIIRLPKEEAGPWQVHTLTAIDMPVPVKVIGSRQPRLDFYPKDGTAESFLSTTTQVEGNFEFWNFDIIGPNTPNDGFGAIERTERDGLGDFIVRNVNVSGRFSFALQHAGNGFTSIHGCTLEAWEEPIGI